MVLPSTLFCLLLSLNLVSGQFLTDDRTTRRPRKGEHPEKGRIQDRQQRAVNSTQGNHECQEGNPLGANYSGSMNVTTSGRTCQVWAASQPHEHSFTHVGEHSHCRNPSGELGGVWCYTTDPDKQWEYCSLERCVTGSKVFDFHADNDRRPDSNWEYTTATLNAGPLPESFTVCSAIMTEAWRSADNSAPMVCLWGNGDMVLGEGNSWATVDMYATPEYTVYEVLVKASYGNDYPILRATSPAVVYPLQWTRACLSLDSNASKMRLVVDGQLLGEEEYRRDDDYRRPTNLSLVLGGDPHYEFEKPIKLADLNVFKSSLSVERMVGLTRAGEEECGAAGDLVSWEEAEWTLHSQAKVIEVDREWEGPCRRESQVQVFTADFEYHHGCMWHCKKIANGTAPSVITEEEWKNLIEEIDLITQDRSILKYIWLSATEGDKNKKLARLDHWPETELFNNQTRKLEAEETVWRDFYTGQRLENWGKPYYISTGLL